MGFEQRYDLFDLQLTWPDPLAPGRLRREVPERVGHDRQVLAALDLESTRAAVRDLVEVASVEAIAKRDAPRCARDPHRHRGARRAAGRTRSDPRRLGGARDRERGRGAGVSHPRVGTRVRLPEVVDGRVRRLGPRARARDRPQAPHPARHLSHRGGCDVGARAAREPARLRGLAFAPGVPRRSRRRVVRRVHRAAGRGGFGVSPPGGHCGPAHQHPARHALSRHALSGAGLRDRGDPARRRHRYRLRRSLPTPRRAVPRQVRRDLRGDVSRRTPRDRELEGGGGGRGSGARLRRHRGRRPRARNTHATSGSATPSSSARSSTATHSRRGRRSTARPSSRSASRPACSAPATGPRWTRT